MHLEHVVTQRLVVLALCPITVFLGEAGAAQATVQQSAAPPQSAAPGTVDSRRCRATPGGIEVVAHAENAVALIEKIAARTGAGVRVLGVVNVKVSLDVCATSVEDAIAHVTRSGGLSYRLVDGSYYIAPEADLIAELASADDTTEIDTFYRCRHLDAVTLVDLLKRLLPKELMIIPGPQFISPSVQAVAAAGAGISLTSQGASFHTHDVVLSGPTNLVKRAILLARKLDRKRKQVRISVQVTDVTSDGLRELGITWTWGTAGIISFVEERDGLKGNDAAVDLRLGRFVRAPIPIAAKLSALEEKNQAHLLTNAHLVVLDGERSYVLTGTKYLYPKLVSTNATGMPNYDIAELKVGIYMQVAVQVGLDKDIVMTVYPQVSNVAGFQMLGGSPYPIISTREQQTTVTVLGGETLAIGGLKQEDSLSAGQQVPYLASIPLVGKFFQYHNKSDKRSELVVLITPELID
jgi:type II secretory pathway component GspD/PulD (secretin)